MTLELSNITLETFFSTLGVTVSTTVTHCATTGGIIHTVFSRRTFVTFGLTFFRLILPRLTLRAICRTFLLSLVTEGTASTSVAVAFGCTGIGVLSRRTFDTFGLTFFRLMLPSLTLRAICRTFLLSLVCIGTASTFAAAGHGCTGIGVLSWRAWDAACLASRWLMLTRRAAFTWLLSIRRVCAPTTISKASSNNVMSKIWTDRVVVGSFFLQGPTIRGIYIN